MKIAIRLGIHRNSVNRYVTGLNSQEQSYKELYQLSDAVLSSLFLQPAILPSDPRYEPLKLLFPFYEKALKKVGCTYQTLWYGCSPIRNLASSLPRAIS